MNKHTIVFITVAVLTALSFASWRMWGPSQDPSARWPELAGGVYAQSVRDNGLQYLVPPDEVYDSGLEPQDRPALTNPNLDDITTADAKLADELEGIAVSVGGTQRFYPFQILNWHEIVHDDVNGEGLVITYSPLTGSAVVYSSQADAQTGERHHFEDSGKVYNNALLMVDGHGTFWNQTTGQAIVGESVGQRLSIYPSRVMTWGIWKELYPGGLALSTNTGFARDYGRHPYASYETSPGIFFPLNFSHSYIEPKDIAYRVEGSPQPLIFMKRYLPMQANPNATLSVADTTLQMVAFYDEDLDTARVFKREHNGQTLTFIYTGGKITDEATGSRWSPEGVAVSGELRGAALEEIPVTRHYAFAHWAMYPNTLLSGAELLPTEAAVDQGEVLEIN